MTNSDRTSWFTSVLALSAALLAGAGPVVAQETETDTAETETIETETTETEAVGGEDMALSQCTLDFQPATVPVSETPVTVVATLSDSIGTLTTVGAESPSGLVLSLATDEAAMAEGELGAEAGVEGEAAVEGEEHAEVPEEELPEETGEAEAGVEGEAAYGQEQDGELGYEYGAPQGAAQVKLHLDASAAQTGTWEVWAEGSEGTCEGTIEVTDTGTDTGFEDPMEETEPSDTMDPVGDPVGDEPVDEPVGGDEPRI